MSEIFHRCRHLGIEMTREEYWAYLRECEKDDTKRIRTQIGRRMLRYIDNHTEDKGGMLRRLRRKVEEYVRSMERPQVVELSLF